MCLNIKYYHEIVAMKISNNVDLLIDCSRHVVSEANGMSAKRTKVATANNTKAS